MYSHISFWWSQIGSAFLRMNSSTLIPSIVGGRLIRFCFPLINMAIYSCWRFLFAAFSAGVNFRFGFPMTATVPLDFRPLYHVMCQRYPTPIEGNRCENPKPPKDNAADDRRREGSANNFPHFSNVCPILGIMGHIVWKLPILTAVFANPPLGVDCSMEGFNPHGT